MLLSPPIIGLSSRPMNRQARLVFFSYLPSPQDSFLMRSFLLFSIQFFSQLPRRHKQIIALICVSIAALTLLPHNHKSDTSTPSGTLDQDETITDPTAPTPGHLLSRLRNDLGLADSLPIKTPLAKPTEPTAQPATEQSAPQQPALPDVITYQVRKGDTLSAIFADKALPQQTLYAILDADQNVLALDTIKPGDILHLTFDQDHQLQKLDIELTTAHHVSYTLQDDEGFVVKETRLKGQWQSRSLQGDIKYSFTGSVEKAGLSAADSQLLTDILGNRIDFRRDIRAGDHFEIILSEQTIKGAPTGKTKVEAISIDNRLHPITAYLFEGTYYDSEGRSLEKAFRRYPFKGHYRVSSLFNPHRKNPVTGLIRPHNGTDFAVPVGTHVLATGDGVVTRVVHHKYAGIYIQIQHGPTYTTRYLHLSKPLVHKGQHITRGQLIALSGNTGRSTGPHLHYEFHINHHPVNPLKAKIPLAKTLTRKEKKRFNEKREQLQTQLQQLNDDGQQLAKTTVADDASNSSAAANIAAGSK